MARKKVAIKKYIIEKLDNIGVENINQILQLIKNYEYISFDIFDTLIKRDVIKPTDVFELIEKHEKIDGFKQARIEAEKIARESSVKEDVSLDEIYNCFETNIDISGIKCIERQYEIELCCVNKKIKDIYQWCVDNDKKIIIISDMYLDRQTIEHILQKNGVIKYYKLYISNECNASKHSGTLYDYVLDDLCIAREKIVHIGNSIKADYFSAKKRKINAIKIPTQYTTKSLKYVGEESKRRDFLYLNKFIRNRIDCRDFYYDFGYECFGPALVGFCKWTLENMMKQKRRKAIFLGRDGYIIKQVYDLLGYDEIIPSYYMEVSRRAFRIIDLLEVEPFEVIFGKLPLRKFATIKELIECLCLNSKDVDNEIEKCGLNIENTYKSEEFLHNDDIKAFYELILSKVRCNAKDEFENLCEYLNTYELEDNVGLIDVGWGGTIQHYLERCMAINKKKSDILGYYFGVSKRAQGLLGENKAQGYFYDCLSLEDKYDYQRPFDGFFETLFLQQIGSVKRYRKIGDDIIIERENYEYKDDIRSLEIVNRIQNGAAAFAKDFKKSIYKEILDCEKEVMFANLYRVCTNPTLSELSHFENINFYDSGNLEKLFESYSCIHILIHPVDFYKGYCKAYWRIAYLKKIFHVKLPYMDICLRFIPEMMKLVGSK